MDQSPQPMPQPMPIEIAAETPEAPGPGRIYLEPKVCLHTGTVIGHEALFRPSGWENGAEAFYRELQSQPLIERVRIEGAILRRASAAIASDLAVSFNVSLPLLLSIRGLALVEQIVGDRAHGRTTIELLETDAPDLRMLLPILGRLVDLGALIAIDDFGKGHSTLALAGTLPHVHEIKLDESIVHSPNAEAVVPAMVQMAARLGAITTAEHVNSAECAARMQRCGVHNGQGFLYGTAVSLLA